jgi:autotransporter-associated beta strand protein
MPLRHLFVGLTPHMNFLARCALLLVSFLALGMEPASAQQTILYTNGVNDSSPITITSSTNPTTLSVSGESATQSGAISDFDTSGIILKTGAGTLTLTGTNTYTGGTTISAGTLKVGAALGGITLSGRAELRTNNSIGFADVTACPLK